MKSVKVRIEGKVQGVWFRAWTEENAITLGIDGWVRNLPDGSVEALFSGREAAVNRMLAACEKGPPLAKVSSVIPEDCDPPSDPGFSTRHDI